MFYPQVPVIVCSKLREKVAAMPASSCFAVSHTPSIIAIAVRRDLRTDFALKKAGIFSINWLSYGPDGKKLIAKLSNPRPSGSANKLGAFKIEYYTIEGQPILKRVAAYAICSVENVLQTGDHDLFLSKVIVSKASRDFEEYWQFRYYKPILYMGSKRKRQFTTIYR